MEPTAEQTLSFHHGTYDDLLDKLEAVTNKESFTSLAIKYVIIGNLTGQIWNSFVNLINLELSNCDLLFLQRGIFAHLVQLKSINLSNNMFFSIDNHFLIANQKLETIILKNNLLDSINKTAFSTFDNLEVLDLSYNFISILKDGCINCLSLKVLFLNNNTIRNISETAFHGMPNLTDLTLYNNKISQLTRNVFKELFYLEHLFLNNNVISEIHYDTFWRLSALKSIHLGSNCLTQPIQPSLFPYCNNLTEIDLSDNEIKHIDNNAFSSCDSLQYLNLKVTDYFDPSTVGHLKSLQYFQLYYKLVNKMYSVRNLWSAFYDKVHLTFLKLIFDETENLILCNLSHLINLEHLHIECLSPNENFLNIRLNQIFNGLHKLKTLAFIKLNRFVLTNCFLQSQNIKYLTLVGLSNDHFDDIFFRLYLVTYLNLSGCNVQFIRTHSFRHLFNLEHLIFENSKLARIDLYFVCFNYKLLTLNCAHCCIVTIEDFSFQNLSNLRKLDLRHNFITEHTENTFSGLNRDICAILL